MARSNKYTSINLNDVFDKKLNNNATNNNKQPATNNPSAKSFQNQSKTVLSNSRIHGHMLVLTRPTPKPIANPQKPDNKDKGSPVPATSAPAPDQTKGIPEPVSISLRPQGRTGSGPPLTSPTLPSPVSSLPTPLAKSDRFVPPHLRPGFVGKEEKPGPELVKGGGGGSFKGKAEVRGRPGQHLCGLDPIERRPKSGGGYEPIGRGCELGDLNRPGSSGARPSSSG